MHIKTFLQYIIISYNKSLSIMELTPNHIHELMKRFPNFELSYETISHKKVSPSYNICLAIPQGKKCYIWFTFHCDKDVCILLDLNREKKITKATIIDVEFNNKLELGTILYGSLIDEDKPTKFFIIEDISYYKGISLKRSNQQEKLSIIQDFVKNIIPKPNTSVFLFVLPILWKIENKEDFECPAIIPDTIQKNIGYQVHHIQYRCLTDIKPYLNVFINRKLNFSAAVTQDSKKEKTHSFDTVEIKFDYSKPQYRYPTVFQVTADIQFDIYHLFCYGVNNKPMYYGIAGIPNYKTSVYMNGLFRKIKENINLDAIEESDDEEEFEDMTEDKYVDIQKVLLMEFIFNPKFKKWIPVRVVDNSFTPLNNLNRTAVNYSTKLPVTDLNGAPQLGVDSNHHGYKVVHISKLQYNPGDKQIDQKSYKKPFYNHNNTNSNSNSNSNSKYNSKRYLARK